MVQLFKVNIKTKLIDIVSESIPEFRPIAKDKSEIINEERRQLIACYLPPLIRMREWKKLFTMDHDGVSMHTFYKNV